MSSGSRQLHSSSTHPFEPGPAPPTGPVVTECLTKSYKVGTSCSGSSAWSPTGSISSGPAGGAGGAGG